jgi:signal transduction histidine kinase
MPQIFRSLRFRLLLIVLLALLPAFGLAIYNASQQRHLVQNQVQEDALDIAQSLANHQNELVEGARQMLFVLAQLPVIRGDDDLACKAYLTELKANNPRYMNIIKWDLAGNMLCDAANSPLPHKSPFPDHLEMVLDSMDFVINGFVISPHTNERALSFGYPVLDEYGQPKNVLVAPVYLDSLNQLLTQADLPAGSTITLRDGGGTVLARSPQPGNWVGELDPDMLAAPALADLQGEGTLEARGADGVLRLYAYTPVFSPTPEELYLIVGIPYQDAMGVVELTLERSLFILVVAGFVALVAILLGTELFFLRPIQKLLGVTRRMTAGDLSVRADVAHEVSELSELSSSFDQMAEALEKRELERQKAVQALKKEEAARARMLHQVITANEDERMRISRELHDETSQNLTALMLGLDTAGIALDKDPGRASEHFGRVKSIAQELLQGIHHLIYNLRPPLLDDLGLVPAILMCADKQLKPLGINMHLQVDNPENRLPPYIETALFRIVQEAFTNIIRHSHAKNVQVRLTQSDHTIGLKLMDDGQGFDAAILASDPPVVGFGLQGMQERVRMLDGEFNIETTIGEGTRITMSIPIPKAEGEHV